MKSKKDDPNAGGDAAPADADTEADVPTDAPPDHTQGEFGGIGAVGETTPIGEPGLDRAGERAAAQQGNSSVVARWRENAMLMVEEIERHVKTSHGLHPDIELLKKVAAHVRELIEGAPIDLPAEGEEPAPTPVPVV